MSGVRSVPPRSQPPSSARGAGGPKSERAKRTGAVVSLGASGALLPASCACCGEPAAQSAVARAPGGAELIVGYCEECAGHIGREATRKLAAAVASGLIGLGLALALPFAQHPLGLLTLALAVLLGSLAPILVVLAWPRTPGAGHSAEGPAVRWQKDGELLCANDRFATELGRANGASLRRADFRERRLVLRVLVVPLVSSVAAVAIVFAISPVVRIVNLGTERVVIEVDGQSVVAVEPTSVEEPTAGSEVRVTAGEHELGARVGDRLVERAEVRIESGHAHLFAPASDGYCFWLETAEYGRARSGQTTREALTGPPHFWVLPKDLGGWFRPVPEQARSEARLTGGAVTVLRQAPCGLDP